MTTEDYNKLYLQALSAMNNLFLRHGTFFYHTNVGTTYKKIFNRDALACIGFKTASGEFYYMYFNSAYNPELYHFVFTSISVVSKDNLSLGNKILDAKHHIESVQDVLDFAAKLEGVL